MDVVALLLGAGLAVGVLGIVAGWRGAEAPRPAGGLARWRARRRSAGTQAQRRHRQVRALAGWVVFAVVWAVSGVFVLAVLMGAAVVGVPALLASRRQTNAHIARLEALAEWTQRLSTVLRTGKGLQQAMRDSRHGCPQVIREQVSDLAERLEARWTPAEALAAFAEDLADVTSDRVVAALQLAVGSSSGRGLPGALERFAVSVRWEVSRRQQIEADREKSWTTVRVLTWMGAGLPVAGLLVPSYAAPYASALGQVVLAVLTCAFIAVLWWMRRLSLGEPVPRYLIADPRSVVAQQAAGEKKTPAGEEAAV